MATTIEQQPFFEKFPVGHDVMFSISNSNIVASEEKVKIVAKVLISSEQPPNPSNNNDLVGTFKTSPNNAGVGMFNFRPIIENFVSADNIASDYARYKNNPINISSTPLPMHIIDKFSRSKNTMVYFAVVFTTEYLDNDPASLTYGTIIDDGTPTNTRQFRAFNGYVKYTDDILIQNNDFGFDTDVFDLTDTNGRFLTNAPLTQYANKNDYGTVPFMSSAFGTVGGSIYNLYYIDYFKIIMYNGSTILGDFEVNNTTGNGGYSSFSAKIDKHLMFFGCFPANLQQWNSTFYSNLNGDMTHYTIQTWNLEPLPNSELITINIKCPNTKGYEPIRLTWLNQWGGWDYYTFNMKSSKSISTKGSTYQQLEGNWNASAYRLDSYKGGKKSFRVNATEKISMNTDFVSESESEWFEELINSPEIYTLESLTVDHGSSSLNKYVTPVRLLTSNYTRKTVANDKLMQYTFEVEKTKTLNTQAV